MDKDTDMDIDRDTKTDMDNFNRQLTKSECVESITF
jgi:hypothetical protein